MQINSKQLKAVIALPGPKRYGHFIKVAADQNQVWGLYNEGWALAATAKNTRVFPFWPAREYAELCAKGDWPKSIPISDLLDILLPRFRKDGTLVGAFYTPHDKGVTPTLDQFEADMRAELSKLE